MSPRSVGIAFAFVIALYATPAISHHAAAEFDTDVVIEFEGVIKDFVWANPHIRAILETRSDTGAPLTLEIEGNSPTTLRTMGVSAGSLAPGDSVTATVSLSKRFPDESALGHRFVKADGTVVPFTTNRARLAAIGAEHQDASRAEVSASTIFSGTWVPRGGPGPLLQQSREWTLTAKGRERFDSYTPLMTPQAQCVPTSAPWIMAYSAATEFQRLDDRIVFKSDWMRAERTIYMDARDHPPADAAFPQGHSVGRWEGDTLVVETANFSDIIYGAIANGSEKRLVERFAVSADGKQLLYDFAMADPEYLVGEVAGEIRFDYRPDLTLENLECDSETARRFFREFE